MSAATDRRPPGGPLNTAGGFGPGAAARPPVATGAVIIAIFYVLIVLAVLVNKSASGWVANVDELFTLCLLPFCIPALLAPRKDLLIVLALFGLYISMSFVSSLTNDLNDYPRIPAATLGVVLDTKFIIVAVALVYLLRDRFEPESYDLFLTLVVAIALANSLFVFRDIVFGGTSMTGHPLAYRNGFILPQGLFTHKINSSNISFLGSIAAGCLFVHRDKKLMGPAWLLLTATVLVHFDASDTFIISLLSVIIALKLGQKNEKYRIIMKVILTFAIVIAAIPIAIVFGDLAVSRLQTYTGASEDLVRTAMHYRAVDIASHYFPFGSGAGTYGSAPSRDLYFSPVYDLFELSHMWGASRENSRFLMDTFWPKVIGESGFVGFIAYASMLLYILLRSFQNMRQADNSITMFCFLMMLYWSVDSIAAAPFTNIYAVPMLGLGFAFTILMHGRLKQSERRLPTAGFR